MDLQHPGALFLVIGTITFTIGGAVAAFRLSVTWSNIALVAVTLFAITCGLWTVFFSPPVADVEYRAEGVKDNCTEFDTDFGGHERAPVSEQEDRVHEYSELSPEGEELFQSALQAEEYYTTNQRADEFVHRRGGMGTISGDNYVTYQSRCYRLFAVPIESRHEAWLESDEDRGSPLRAIGALLTLVFGGTSGVQWRRRRT